MPTIKLDINTGIEYSPTDGIDAGVKLHNFTVGTDGSLYKLPALKNLKNTYQGAWHHLVPSHYYYWLYHLLDIKKFQTSAIQETISPPDPLNRFIDINMFRRFIFLTEGSYGVININYDGERIDNSDLSGEVDRYGEFEHTFLTLGGSQEFDLTSLNPQILVDFNSQYEAKKMEDDKNRHVTNEMRCIFPCQYRFVPDLNTDDPTKGIYKYIPLIKPRNVVHCKLDADLFISEDKKNKNPLGAPSPPIPPLGTDLKALTSNENIGHFNPKNARYNNDLARGCVSIGNRMFFYSALDNAIYVSKKNDFTSLEKSDGVADFRIIPTEEIQGITDFNGNIITFTPTGIERWVLSDPETMLERDPTFHYDHRIRYGGSFVKANRDLYFYTDDFRVYRLNSDLTVDSVFNGILPTYEPIKTYLARDKDIPISHFKMLGYRFISIGMWLYNIDSNTWSTYSYDGWKKPNMPTLPDPQTILWQNDTAKQCISVAYDDIICTYSTICRPLSYEEMRPGSPEAFDDTDPSLEEGKHQWGEVSFFSTRIYQDDRTFSLDGIQVYVRGGILSAGSKMWVKILRGSAVGDFDMDDEDTYGVAAEYQPIEAIALGEGNIEHTGKFIWHTNVKTDRFRLQFICKEKRGIVIQSVMANITKTSDSQEFLLRKQEQKEGKQ